MTGVLIRGDDCPVKTDTQGEGRVTMEEEMSDAAARHGMPRRSKEETEGFLPTIFQREHGPPDTLIWYFQPSELEDDTFLLF